MPSVSKASIKRARLEYLPADWRVVSLGSIASTQYGLSIAATEAGSIPMLGMRDLVDGRVSLHDPAKVDLSKADIDSYHLDDGDILFNRTNSADLVGKSAVFRNGKHGQHVFASYLVRVATKRREANPDFVCLFMNSGVGQHRLRALATPGVSQYNINPSNLRNDFLLPLPPLIEQDRIVRVLREWDESTGRITRLIEQKRLLKKGLGQKLLFGKRRFAQFGKPSSGSNLPSGWRRLRFNEVFRRIIRKANASNDLEPLSITAKVGFVTQREKFSKVIAGAQAENYIHLKRGEFAYNKGNSTAFPQGCIYRLTEFEEALVPRVYFCFSPTSDLANSDFYAHYFEGGLLNHQLSRLINSGVRNDGLLNLSADDFFQIGILVPPIQEQEMIARALSAAASEIQMLERVLEKLRVEKRGLMQKLLTGQIRVKEARNGRA